MMVSGDKPVQERLISEVKAISLLYVTALDIYKSNPYAKSLH